MRAQWVCSRERRMALYKRSSINQSIGASRMWTRSVCFAGIRCGTKTGASLLFCTAAFFSPGKISFSFSFFLFSLCGNLRFPDSSHAWRELTYSVHVCIITCVYVANSVHVCITSVLLCAFLWLTYSVHVCIIMCVYVANSVHECIIS